MGQKRHSTNGRRLDGQHSTGAKAIPSLSVFATDLGWFGLVGGEKTVWGLTIGHIDRDAVRSAAGRLVAGRGNLPAASIQIAENDWHPDLRRRLEQYAAGGRVGFDEFDVRLAATTDFQRRVLLQTRRVKWGETVSYARLAERAEAPRAARAVGSVMASNQAPILIPCHRVVGSGGRLGGFSAPQGVDLKRRMLEMEGAALAVGSP